MDTDFLLILKMKQGKEAAFDQFVRKYYDDILRYCRYHCFDTEYAQDLAQETFFRFFANLPQYHYKGKTKNYLYTIAGNLCKNFYYKKRDLPVEREELERESVSSPDPFENILEQMVIEQAIKKLPVELSEVVILFYFQELKLSEIADIADISLPLVKYRLRQARKQLAALIGSEESCHSQRFTIGSQGGKEELYEGGTMDGKI